MDLTDVPAHPPPAELDAYCRGRLPAAAARRLEAHLSDCPACGEALDRLPADGFLSGLRAAAGTATDATDTDPLPEVIPAALLAHPRYTLGPLLGRGGMGSVYMAEHTLMGRPVALKVIAARLLAQAGGVDRVVREVRAAARLHHPHIVTAFDAEQVGPLTVLVMEYVPGHTLAQHLFGRGRLPVAEACEYARQAALGLQHAHDLGMVHRDIKPANLMLTPDRRVKILDFGLARFVAEAADPPTTSDPDLLPTDATVTGLCLGTLDYVAPEQADDARAVGPAADVYALGATLYHLLGGRPPFPGGRPADKLRRLATHDPDPLDRLRPDLPPGLGRVVERMMAKRPEERPPSAAAVADALEPFTGRRPKRRRALAAVAGLLVAAVIAVGLTRLARPPEPPLAVETDDPAVTVVAAGDRVERVFNTKTRVPYRLDRTGVPLAEADAVGGLRLALDDMPVALTHGPHGLVVTRLGPPASGLPGFELERVFAGHTAPVVQDAGISPDGTLVATVAHADLAPVGRPDAVRVWGLATGREVRAFAALPESVGRLAFTADGSAVLASSRGGLWRLPLTGPDPTVPALSDTGRVGIRAGFSVDGRRAVVVDDQAHRTKVGLRVWDVIAGRPLRDLPGPRNDLTAVAVAPDGRWAVTCGGREAPCVQVWDAEAGIELAAFPSADVVNGVAVAPDGRRFAWAGRDGVVRVGDRGTDWTVREFAPPDGTDHRVVRGLVFTPDSRWLLTLDENRAGGLRLWDADTGRLAAEQPVRKGLAVVVAPDSRRCVTTHADGTARTWRLPTAVPGLPPARPRPSPPSATNGPRLRVVHRHPLPEHETEISPGRFLPVAPHMFHADVSADGSAYAVWGDDSLVRLWDTATGRLRSVVGGPGDLVGTFACVGPDRLLTTSGRVLRLRLLSDGTTLQRELHTATAAVLAATPDGRRAAVYTADRYLYLWDVDGWKRLRSERLPFADRVGAAISPDGRRVYGWCGGNTLVRWDADGGEPVTATGPGDWAADARVLADGRLVAYGHDGLSVRDPVSLAEVRRLPLPTDFRDRPNWAVSPDGRWLVYAEENDDFIRLLDFQTGVEVHRLPLPARPSGRLAFTPDGRHVAVGGFRGWVFLLRLEQ